MSRIGNAPIPLPVGVSAEVNGNTVTVRGPRGQLARALHPTMTIRVADAVITVARPSDAKPHREMHGLTRTLVANMVTGVSAGYQKVVELYGVGYRVPFGGADAFVVTGEPPLDAGGLHTDVERVEIRR